MQFPFLTCSVQDDGGGSVFTGHWCAGAKVLMGPDMCPDDLQPG